MTVHYLKKHNFIFQTQSHTNLSTDGAPVDNRKSTSRSFCPFSIVLNYLPPNIRFKHVLLVGIMLVSISLTHLKNKLRTRVVEMAELYNKNHRGVKDRSYFCNFINIDMVKSFSIEPMHNGVLGVADQMWNLMRPKLSPSSRTNVDSMLLQIKPPHEVHRVPCKLTKKSLWESTHWKSCML